MIRGRQQSVSQLMTRCMCRGWKGCHGERLEHRGHGLCPIVLSQPGRPTFTESPLLPSLPGHLWAGPALSHSLQELSLIPDPRSPCLSFPRYRELSSCRGSVPPSPRSKESGTLLAFRGCSRGSRGRVWLLMAMTVPMTSAAAPRSTCCACAPAQGGVFPVPESPSE